MTIISRENRGLIASLNEGIKKAKGKYIVRMDADDISLPARIKTQVEFMEDNPMVGISGSAVLVFGDNQKTYIWKLSKENDVIKTELLFSSPFAHPSVIMNREMIVTHNLYYDIAFLHAEDFELWTRMAKYTRVANIDEVLLKYRVVANSITREANKDIEKRYAIHKKIFNTYLTALELENSDEEYRLHFNISLNKRIKETEIDFKELEQYLNKLLMANKNTKFFDTLELKKVLGKKWLVNMYYRKKFSKIFSKYFLYGILGLIHKWIR
jgi:glycosyltransferase involved in cell wall biosynthesis